VQKVTETVTVVTPSEEPVEAPSVALAAGEATAHAEHAEDSAQAAEATAEAAEAVAENSLEHSSAAMAEAVEAVSVASENEQRLETLENAFTLMLEGQQQILSRLGTVQEQTTPDAIEEAVTEPDPVPGKTHWLKRPLFAKKYDR